MLSLIVAAAKNNVIGDHGRLPWHLPADLKYFKQITLGHTIVMGRLTFESIGRPLPRRKNIVLTTNPNYQAAGCDVIHTIEDILKLDDEVFIIGGAKLYEQMLPYCQRLYLTRVQTEITGDTVLPDIDFSKWQLEHETQHPADEKNCYALSFLQYKKKNI